MANQWTGTGNLGRDPELRTTRSGRSVLNLSLACDRVHYRDSGNGTREKVSDTDWMPIVVWGRLAETCAQYLQKGSKILVMGQVRPREYQDRDGNTRYTFEIVADNVEFLAKTRTQPATVAPVATSPAAVSI